MVFEMTRIDHIGIATGSIEKSSKFWNMLGFEDSGDEIVESQGVKIRYLKGEDATRVELLEPLSDCLLYTSPSPRDRTRSRMPSSA